MGFLPNVFALNMSMQRHPNTHIHMRTHTHRHIHILTFAHTQDPWINSQALVWQGNTGNFRQLPLPACQTWGSRSVLVVFGYACLLCFICQSQLMLLYRKNFDRINVLFLDFHPNSGNQWVHLMRCRESLYFWGKKKMSVDMMSQGFYLKEETATV